MKTLFFMIAALAMSAPVVQAAPDLAAGERIATQGNDKGALACLTCHGVDGMGNAAAGFPRLAGMNADYLAKQLRDYVSGARQSPVMQPFSTALSADDVQAVSAYYANLAPSAQAQTTVAPAAGRDLALRGDWERDIPACIACHGPDGRGVGAAFPALAGQSAGYIRDQIQAWQKGTRRNDPNDLMRVVAERMSPEQIQAVADYFATVAPVAANNGVANR